METKRLTKSDDNRVLCGVCGGIGEYFNIDPVHVPAFLVVEHLQEEPVSP